MSIFRVDSDASDRTPAPGAETAAGSPAIALVLGAILLALATLGPSPLREVAQGDDWAYRLGVQHWLEGEGFVDVGWGDPTLIFHLFWGTLFGKILGDGYGSLRLATFAWIPAVAGAGFAVFRRCGLSRSSAVGGATLLVFNPLALPLAGSFNSDFSFFGLSVLGIWLALRAYEHPSPVRSLGFGIVVAAAFLTRQPGALLGLSGALLLVSRGRSGRLPALVSITPLALAVGLAWLLIPRAVMWEGLANTPKQSAFGFGAALRLFGESMRQLLGGSLLVAFVASPLLWAGLARPTRTRLGAVLVLSGALVLTVHFVWVDVGTPRLNYFPLQGNYFCKATVGTVSGMASPLPFPWFWKCLTYLLPLVVALLSLRSVAQIAANVRCRNRRSVPGTRFVLPSRNAAVIVTGLSLTLFLPMLFAESFYDRYLLPLFLPALIWAGRPHPRPLSATGGRLRSALTLVATAALALFSWEWNRAQADRLEAHWLAAESLVEQGYRREEISARFEWEGHHLYALAMKNTAVSFPLDMEGPRPWETLQDLKVSVFEEKSAPQSRPVLATYRPFLSDSTRDISVRRRY